MSLKQNQHEEINQLSFFSCLISKILFSYFKEFGKFRKKTVIF